MTFPFRWKTLALRVTRAQFPPRLAENFSLAPALYLIPIKEREKNFRRLRAHYGVETENGNKF
jgi:hypothetical protein